MPGPIFSVDDALARARVLEKAGEWDGARQLYQAVLKQHPGNKLVKKRLKSLQASSGAKGSVTRNPVPDQAQIDEMVGLYRQGRLPEALSRAAELCARFPDVSFLHNFSGVVHARMGRAREALASYDRALELEPGSAEVLNNRGNTLGRLGRQEEAIASFQEALIHKPNYAEACNNLGSLLHEQGRFEEAINWYSRALQINPNYAEAHNGMGNALRDLDKPEEAVACFATALANHPGFVQAHKNMGDALRSQGKLDQAMNSYRKAIQLAQAYPEPYLGLGLILNDLGKHQEAIHSFNRAIQYFPRYAAAYGSLGNAQSELGLHEEAMASYRTALEINPGMADVHCRLGNSLSEFGRTDEAIESYTAALGLKPELAEAHINLSRLKRYREDDPQISQMLERMADPQLNQHERMHLSFALGKVYEDLGDVDLSFRYFLKGNKLRREFLSYDINTDRAKFAHIKSLFCASNSTVMTEKFEGSSPGKQPILIVGMPRSGTSLTEQILASHSLVWGGGELEGLERLLGPAVEDTISTGTTRMTPQELLAYRDSYLKEVASRSRNAPFLTDKMPTNFKWIGFVLTAMPGVKIVHVRRSPIATCWSMFKLQFRGHGFSNDLGDLAEYYKLYLDLMDFWRKEFPGQVYDLDYELLTQNQEQETRKLLDFCGLDWEEQCLDFHKTNRAVRTLSDNQVRQKMYTGSSEAWKKYRHHLQPLIAALGEQD
jgi:tetratricopeptide (TPR) repeat protein